MAEPTTADASEASAPAVSRSSNILLILVSAVIAALCAGGTAYWFATKGNAAVEQAEMESSAAAKKQGKPKGPPIYVELDPPFVVNFEARGMMRFLQVTVQVMTRDPMISEKIKQHDPVIRNDLLLLLGSQSYDVISTREGKEQLRADALQAVRNVVDAEGGNGKLVEQLYFTSFVMQ